jgi:hypothetical protein
VANAKEAVADLKAGRKIARMLQDGNGDGAPAGGLPAV